MCSTYVESITAGIIPSIVFSIVGGSFDVSHTIMLPSDPHVVYQPLTLNNANINETHQNRLTRMPCQIPNTSFVPLQPTRYKGIIQVYNFNQKFAEVNEIQSSSHTKRQLTLNQQPLSFPCDLWPHTSRVRHLQLSTESRVHFRF